MKVLLDENFPLRLLHALRTAGIEAEHIITLGWRGAPDTRIHAKVEQERLLFVTQDDEFLGLPFQAGCVVVSRVRQSRPVSQRIELWLASIRDLLAAPRKERLFELTDDGVLVPWQLLDKTSR